MKTKYFFSAAAYAAMAFIFFACSSDDSGNNSGSSAGGSNFADLPKQVYFVETDHDDNDNLIVLKKEKYEGNGDLAFLFSEIMTLSCSGSHCECTNYNGDVYQCSYEDEDKYDTIPAGKIQNGQISLDLPTSIDSKYLRELESCDDTNCQISIVPENLTSVEKSYLYATIPNENDCRVQLRLAKSGKTTSIAYFYYYSESGKITGTEKIYSYSYDDGGDIEDQINLDMSFSKGWNLAYYYDNYLTTNLPKGEALEWWLKCDQY
ncbi:MAG: hypothetical protein FWH22_04925 [Fibromonadales bacterium]|nr:hypothetical protein [Fibromonadales bacterium]